MKKKLAALLLGAALLGGCSAYKEISPEPEIISRIDGYVQIKEKDKNFKLEKGKKYYLVFPKPSDAGVYLMIENNIKPFAEYYFSNKFLKDAGYEKIADITPADKHLSVFPLDTLHRKFYWIIENVGKDTLLYAKYRYVESWRFGFERDFAKEKALFETVRVEREKYREVDLSQKLTDLQAKLNSLQTKFDTLAALRKRAAALEKYFPRENRTAKDYDYKAYLIFTNEAEEEFLFQKKSLSLLTTIVELKKTENQPELFLQSIPVFYDFLTSKTSIDNSLKNKVKEIIASRLESIEKYYEKEILKKIDSEPFNLYPPLETVENLYRETYGFVPQSFLKYKNFFENFDRKAEELQEYFSYEQKLKKYLAKAPKWLPNRYFDKALKILNKMAENLPDARTSSLGGFKQYTCVTILTEKIKRIKRSLRKYERELKEANFVVAQINRLKKEGAYDEIISLLKANSALSFLQNHYTFLDKDYVIRAVKRIDADFDRKNWAKAESEIKKLALFDKFLKPAKIKAYRDSLANARNMRLFKLVSLYTKARIDSVTEANLGAYENLEEIYSEKVFAPLYVFTFDTRGEEYVKQKNSEIRRYIEKAEYYDYPEKSILKLYDEILRDKNTRGVEKARAVLFHGKFYRGSNKRVKNIIDEFNPNIAKTIRTAKTYRKLYVLPATDNPAGKNTYKFRIQLKIPTEARFPVYEINIKLPKEIAQNAAHAKWYDKITLNGTEIKNEGRIKIIAPSDENDYECKISPVQMNTDGKNILEVTFTFPSYKIYEISVMAQKPLIRKN